MEVAVDNSEVEEIIVDTLPRNEVVERAETEGGGAGKRPFQMDHHR